MSAGDLKLQISAPLLEALGLADSGEGVDYFTLFGLERGDPAKGAVEAAVVRVSKQLRSWQTSPQYGEEVVALLKTLHRAAKILQDDQRRAAYAEALNRIESGDRISAADEFRQLVRAALVDSELSNDARRALNEYVQVRKLDPGVAQRIMSEVREELKAQRAAAKAEEEWEFSLAGGTGEEGYGVLLAGLAQSGQLKDMTSGQLVSQAQKHGISLDRAMQLITQYKLREYEVMVRMVAANRALTTAQAKLLADKAPAYGLDQQQASNIISEYTFTASDPSAFLGNLQLAETFGDEDITQLLNQDSSGGIRRSRFAWLSFAPPDWLLSMVKLIALIAVLGFGGYWVKTTFLDNVNIRLPKPKPGKANNTSAAATNPDQPKPEGTPFSIVSNPTEGTPTPETTPTAAGVTRPPAAGATTTPAPTAVGGLVTLPDPVSGYLAMPSQEPNDPPAFEIAIAEVTNSEFAEYLRATLDPPPPGWTGNAPPAGQENFPVANVSWESAMRYVRWRSSPQRSAGRQYDLPSLAEYRRALRGRTMRTTPATEPIYWERAQLGGGTGPKAIKTTIWDKIFVTNAGQVYDLVGNVAEWGRDEQGGYKAILGGDFKQPETNFNHLEPRYKPADTMEPTIGFRMIRRTKQ